MDLFDILRIFATFLLCGPVQCVWDEEGFNTDASQTFNLVFHKYNSKVRPPQPYVNVTVDVALRHIRRLDIRAQELQTVMDVEINWYDSRLNWDADRINRIMVNASDIWTPDIIITNAVEPVRSLYPDTVKIRHDGKVAWFSKVLVTTNCPTSLGETSHVCTISVGFLSNIRATDKSDRFFTKESNFVLPDEFRNNEWELESADFMMNGDNITKSTVFEIELTLKEQEPPTSTEGRRNATDRLTASATAGSSSRDVTSCLLLLTSVVFVIITQCLDRNERLHR